MTIINLFSKNNILIKCSLLLFLVSSCGDDDSPLAATPTISLQGDSSIIVKNGEGFDVVLTLSAAGGTKELVVNRGGGFLEALPLTAGSTSFTYSNETVPVTAEEGDEIMYEFILVDSEDQESVPVALTVGASVYEEMQIGEVTLYDATIVLDETVPAGTNVKFSAGRNYLISSTLEFGAGTSLTIEEGVTVYLDVAADEPVEIEMGSGSSVSIIGTATNPVVMTSSATIDGTPAPGDWDKFRLDETQNAIVQYLRTEYAGEGLRISDCDDTNTVEYVSTLFPDEEGIRISGGNINFKYLVAVNSTKDGFRVEDDYSGKIQFAIVYADQVLDGDEAMVIRDLATPTIANLTLIGAGSDTTDETPGLRFRGASEAKVYNTIITAYTESGVRINEDVITTDLNGPTVFAYSYVFDIGVEPYREDTDNGNVFPGFIDGDDVFQNPFFNNTTGFDTEGNPILTEIAGIGTNDFIPDATVEAAEAFNPSTIDTFFTSVTFVGAVENEAGDWTKGWVKNPDGTIR